MKKIALFFLPLLVAISGFAENLILENQTPYPKKENSKMAVQWADSAQEVDQENKAIMNGSKVNQNKVQMLKESGSMKLTIPEKAEYFRVLVWSKEEKEPDLLTNWVDIVPDKTYTINEDHLVPSILMLGMGC